MMMGTHRLEQITARLERLPRLSDTAMRLIRVLGDPNSSADQIVETIRYDQTLSTDLLRICNSAIFGLSRKVHSIQQATALLGTRRLLELAVSAHVKTIMTRPQFGAVLDPRSLWKHSVGVGLGAPLCGVRWGLNAGGLLFTAGLLHDVGKVVLNEFLLPMEYAEVLRQADSGVSFHEAETRVLGFHHGEVGARLAESWNLPEEIVRCIRYHHVPAELPEPDLLADAVHVADGLVEPVESSRPEPTEWVRTLSPEVLDRGNLGSQDLETLREQIREHVAKVGAMFQLEDGPAASVPKGPSPGTKARI